MGLSKEDLAEVMQAVLPMMAQMVQEIRKTPDHKGRIDHRALGAPPEWDSAKEDGFLEWQIKLKAWLVNQDAQAIHWLTRAAVATSPLVTEGLPFEEFPTERDRDDCQRFNTLLYNILITKLKGEAFTLVSSVTDGCGLEAWRLLSKRYEPRTPATKRALLRSIFTMKSAKKVEDIERNLLKLEKTYDRYEAMATEKLPEDIKTVIMIELCTPELKEHLEFNTKDVTYKETREAVMA